VKLLTDELRAMIGREATYTAPEELGRASIRVFALAIGDDNPLYRDDDFARANGYDDVIAPPTLVCETNQFIDTLRDPRTHGHDWGITVPNTRLIRGGNEYTFARPVLPSDRVRVRWRIDDITERMARDGKAMLVVTSTATYTNQNDELLATNTETIIHQELA
jgi:acyl dehydratase